MNTHILAISLAAVLVAPVVGADEQTPASVAGATESSPAAEPATPVQSTGGYLGVLLTPVPSALRAQLGTLLPPGQGVMIRDVVNDSPAARAGIETYDVIVGYDDQKLFSPDQLSQLVRAETPDTTVTLNVVHDGAARQTKVTLGAASAAEGKYGYPPTGMPMHHRHAGPYGMMGPAESDDRSWESFDSMSLKKLDDGKFKAEIQFLGDDGKLVKKEFTGSRDAIREQLMGQADLPRTERFQLMDMLSARDRFLPPPSEWTLPGFYMPGFYGPQRGDWQPDY